MQLHVLRRRRRRRHEHCPRNMMNTHCCLSSRSSSSMTSLTIEIELQPALVDVSMQMLRGPRAASVCGDKLLSSFDAGALREIELAQAKENYSTISILEDKRQRRRFFKRYVCIYQRVHRRSSCASPTTMTTNPTCRTTSSSTM